MPVSDERRFLLGRGERLTAPVDPPAGGAPSEPPYEFDEAIQRLRPQVDGLSESLDALPKGACPDNKAVTVVTLHPQALARSYHPKRLLDQYNLYQVGSRPVVVKPEKWTLKKHPASGQTMELYAAGDRRSFQRWARDFSVAPDEINDAIRRVERLSSPLPEDRLRNLDQAEKINGELCVEFVLHAAPQDDYILSAFVEYSGSLGVEILMDKRLYAGGLCFIPAVASVEQLRDLAVFAFVRAVRPAAKLRRTPGIERSTPMPTAPASPLPDKNPLDADLRVAIFDGGLPDHSPLSRWVHSTDPPGIGAPVQEFQKHGHDVLSALLFGSLVPGAPAAQPLTKVDHYRVLDEESSNDPFGLYDVLHRIDDVLNSSRYDFVNLSIGPSTTIEDDDVHPWTALLDAHFAHGGTLATVAAGNNGQKADLAERRVQVPADCLNAVSLGAADSAKSGWARAPYSAIGPGRAPGYVKPDLLDFGGTSSEPFMVADPDRPGGVAQTWGTSFSSPCVLRRAIALRTYFGERLNALGLKALLIHTAQDGSYNRGEVGWGRTSQSLEDMVVCADGQVRVVYQGTLSPAKYLRAQIPLPSDGLIGNVKIGATFTFATEVDPEDPGSYSRAGLDIIFRPHSQKYNNDATTPKSDSFFRRADIDSESALRKDAQKWETTLSSSRMKRATSLQNPVFDIHYVARSNGGFPRDARPIPYALVVSVECGKVPDLYDRVVRAYAGQLVPFQPIVTLPIRVA